MKFTRFANGLCTAAYIQLVKNIGSVCLDGSNRDYQYLGDSLVRMSCRNQPQYF